MCSFTPNRGLSPPCCSGPSGRLDCLQPRGFGNVFLMPARSPQNVNSKILLRTCHRCSKITKCGYFQQAHGKAFPPMVSWLSVWSQPASGSLGRRPWLWEASAPASPEPSALLPNGPAAPSLRWVGLHSTLCPRVTCIWGPRGAGTAASPDPGTESSLSK